MTLHARLPSFCSPHPPASQLPQPQDHQAPARPKNQPFAGCIKNQRFTGCIKESNVCLTNCFHTHTQGQLPWDLSDPQAEANTGFILRVTSHLVGPGVSLEAGLSVLKVGRVGRPIEPLSVHHVCPLPQGELGHAAW